MGLAHVEAARVPVPIIASERTRKPGERTPAGTKSRREFDPRPCGSIIESGPLCGPRKKHARVV